tara:strand:+ start:513 stop:920 length:408 start_codon:yes stop_codon:yes gene_type:complete
MKNLMDKLSTYAALVGVVGAIGGGFYAWGEFNTRLSAVEGVEQATYDLSGIEKNGKKIAVIEEKIGKLDLSGIAVVEKGQKDNSEAIKENEEWIEEVEIKANDSAKENAVLKKELELLKLEIEELKLKAKNPLAG